MHLNGIHPSHQISEYQALVTGVTLTLRGSAASTSLVVQPRGIWFLFLLLLLDNNANNANIPVRLLGFKLNCALLFRGPKFDKNLKIFHF